MEELMQYVWEFRLWPAHRLVTTDGRLIQIIDPGLHNHDAGPDFFNAKVIIGGEHWAGNVEIHVRASDWHRHHHDNDPSYDSVILHVVEVDDTQICRSDGQPIPQFVMKCAPDFALKYHDMVNNQYRELPCGNELRDIPSVYITDWLSALAFERLYAKSERISTYLSLTNNDWSEAIYITLARALGFSTNSEPFQLLAQSTPLKHMMHYTDSLISIEAFLFGQAGLLERLDTGDDKYLTRLCSEYEFLRTKYSLQPSRHIQWKMSRLRPHNSPHRRIAALAKLIYHNLLFSNYILEVQSEEEARKLFKVNLEGYWATHYNFSPEETVTSPAAFGISSINVLLINVIVPVIFTYANNIGDQRRQEFAVELLQSLKPESNRIIDTYVRAGLVPTDAFTTQALIQLRHDYCEQRKCLFCRLGHRLLSQKAPRYTRRQAAPTQ